MPIEKITSRKSSVVKNAAALLQKAENRSEAGLFMAEGARLCADVSIVAGLHDSLLSHLKVSALGTPIALSELQNLFSSLARSERTLNSSHL